MDSTLLWFLLACALVSGSMAAVRRHAARHGSGLLAQRRFRSVHGAAVARLLDGEVDPRPTSPWIAIQLDGHPARLVAAPVPPAGRHQAAIELHERSFPLDLWAASGLDDDLELAAGVDRSLAEAQVERLVATGVDSLARTPGGPGLHVLRIEFDDVPDLARRLDLVVEPLRALERLTPPA